MKYINILSVLFILCIAKQAFASVESDASDFLAKETESTLKITNYKLQKDAQRKADLERKRKDAEAERIRKTQKQLEEQKRHEEELQKLQIHTKLEEQRTKLAEQRQKAEEKRKSRLSRYKLVSVSDKDVVNLSGNRDDFYMEDYSELNAPQDTTSSKVVRDNLVTKEIYIRLLTETNINSRRAGEYTAIVEKDVFSPDSQKILIPKGTKFLCNFTPLSSYGESSLSSECDRIYFPNGKSSIIAKAQVYDAMGRPGIVGTLDNRMFEKYGQTLMLSLLGGAAILGTNKTPNSSVNSLAQYTGLNILDLSTKILDKFIDLSPIVTIPSGTRIILKLSADMNLQNKDEK